MCLEGTSLFAGVFALCAVERFLSTVNQHVAFQVCGIDAGVAALVASMTLLSTMLKPVCVLGLWPFPWYLLSYQRVFIYTTFWDN